MKTKTLLIISVLLFSTILIGAQSEDCYETGGMWNEERSNCAISTGLQINIDYPLAPEGAAFIDAVIQNFVHRIQNETIQQFAEWYDPTLPAFGWALDIDYDEFQHSETVIGYSFVIYSYMGGAHGNIGYEMFTFDLENQAQITYEDLFLPDINELSIISPMVQQILTEQLGEMGDAESIQLGTGENPDNYQYFALTEDALIFYFPPYQVAAYAAGAQMASIPLVDLAEVLAPQFRGQ